MCFPVVVVVLVRMGIVQLAKLKEIRPYVIVGAFIVAAIVTPPDVLSQLMLAIPLCLLYELGLFVSKFYQPKPKTETEEPEATETACLTTNERSLFVPYG